MARMAPVLPVVRPGVKFQPVWVADVARAVAAAALDPRVHGGNIYELGGPETLTMEALNAWIAQAIGRKRTLLPVPDSLARAMARYAGWLPGAPITWDQWLMLQKDNVVSPGMSGFDAFGISPTPLAAVAPGWLVQYRRHGRFGSKSVA
jgi:NADH dehydrogenase